MGRIMALDYGEKKIGVAVSDKSKIFANSKDYILNDDSLFDELDKLIEEYEIENIILGLPLKLNGEDSEITLKVRDFKEELEENMNIEIIFADERLTTSYAEKILISGNVRRKKRKEKIDSLSAQILLQNYLDKIKKS